MKGLIIFVALFFLCFLCLCCCLISIFIPGNGTSLPINTQPVDTIQYQGESLTT